MELLPIAYERAACLPIRVPAAALVPLVSQVEVVEGVTVCPRGPRAVWEGSVGGGAALWRRQRMPVVMMVLGVMMAVSTQLEKAVLRGGDG